MVSEKFGKIWLGEMENDNKIKNGIVWRSR